MAAARNQLEQFADACGLSLSIRATVAYAGLAYVVHVDAKGAVHVELAAAWFPFADKRVVWETRFTVSTPFVASN